MRRFFIQMGLTKVNLLASVAMDSFPRAQALMDFLIQILQGHNFSVPDNETNFLGSKAVETAKNPTAPQGWYVSTLVAIVANT